MDLKECFSSYREKIDISKMSYGEYLYYHDDIERDRDGYTSGLQRRTELLEGTIEESKKTGKLDVSNIDLISLPELPDNLTHLYCSNNNLTSLPKLPDNLVELDCSNNQLTNLPTLPDTLVELYCNNNQLTTLPALPDILVELNYYYNLTLAVLPDTLVELDCSNNQLTTLPALPETLVILSCNDNPFNIIFDNLIDYYLYDQDTIIRNIKEYYQTKIKAKNTVALQLALFKVRSCDIPDHCFSLIGSYLSGEKGSLNTQVAKLRSKLT
jgi:Leucine-rich repeat (LRR) protein